VEADEEMVRYLTGDCCRIRQLALEWLLHEKDSNTQDNNSSYLTPFAEYLDS
jgi:hypothetical protein